MRFLLIIALLACCIPGRASEMSLKQLDSPDGRPNNKINTILRDSDGFLWIGTSSGLSRYDGYSFKNYMPTDSAAAAAFDCYVETIEEDADGRLWIFSGSKYSVYDPVTDKLSASPLERLRLYGIDAEPSVVTISRDKTMWLNIPGRGIFRILPDASKAEAVPDKSLAAAEITELVATPEALVAIDNRGMLRFIDRKTLRPLGSDNTITGSLPGDNAYVFRSVYDRDGLLWIYNNEDLWLYDIASGKWLDSRLPDNGKRQLVKALFQDHSGNLWIGRDHKGLESVEKAERIRFIPAPVHVNSPGSNTVTALYEDDESTLWIGTYKMGVYFHNPGIEKFALHPFPDVNCILPSGSGNAIWIGTDADGIIRWNPADDSSVTYPDTSDGGNSPAITALLEQPDGSLLVGSFARGLRRFAGGNYTRLHTGSRLDNAYTWSLADAGSGKVWVGTLGAGLALFNPQTLASTIYDTSNSDIRSDYIHDITRAPNGTLWLATSRGVSVFNPISEKFSTIAGIEEAKINDLFLDSRGLLWIATTRGLNVYDTRRSRLLKVGSSDPALDKGFILGLSEDNSGRIWLTEGGRIIRLTVSFDDKTGDFSCSSRTYDSADGLQKCDFNQRSFALLPSGRMLVGGLYGINSFIPERIVHNQSLPRVIFSGLSVGSRPVEVGEKVGGKVLLKSSPNHGGRLELWPENSSFTLSLATDNHILPSKTTYYYKLEGFDEDWMTTPPSTNRISYTNLPAGTYRLLVKAVNSDGYESVSPAELEIVMHPPFYASPWAKALYLLLALLAVYGVYRLIRHRERRRFNRKRQEDAIAKQEEINQLKFKFYTNVSHELRTPLTLIVAPLEKMIGETSDERQRGRLNIMYKNAQRLLLLVNQLLDFRKNEVAGLTLHPLDGEIVGFVRGVCQSFANLSERNNIVLDFSSSIPELNCRFDDDKISKAVTNLLANAFKFTPEGGRVEVRVGFDGSNIIISVADNGIGISDADKAHIFERFYQAENATKGGTGNGIGLSMVYEYVRLHGGSIDVTDNPGGGTVFTISLPRTAPEGSLHASPSTILPASTASAMTESANPSPKHESVGLSPAEESSETAGASETLATAEPRPHAPSDKAESGESLPTALIVDDSVDMLELLRDGLRHNFHIITAPDGTEALKLLASIRPSIVLTDLMMPGIDGIELCRRIKARPELASTPVIILTAKHDVSAKLEGMTTGADDYITKPFNIDLLLLKMKRLVSLTSKSGSSLINPEPGNITITPLDEKMVEKAVKYVVANIKRPELSVEELSSHLGMSRVHLYKKLKAITGKTPVEFIRLIRLKRGAQMLRESQLNVSEIAFQLGFNNPKYFSKYFKEEFGVLPSVYQNREGKATNYPV